jgi:hypothetical protein
MNLERQLTRWSHRIPQLNRIGDSASLHERVVIMASKMRLNPEHPYWDTLKGLPDELI